MWSPSIVIIKPTVKIFLQLGDPGVYLLPESDGVDLIEYGFVETLADSIALRAFDLRFSVLDVI